MSLIGDSKEEDREIFASWRKDAKRWRRARAEHAAKALDQVRLLVDNGKVTIDQNGTWNMKIKGISCQYWPTKGRWMYVDPKKVKRHKDGTSSYYVRNMQHGGGITRFLHWLERQQ